MSVAWAWQVTGWSDQLQRPIVAGVAEYLEALMTGEEREQRLRIISGEWIEFVDG